jgi:hypothetical protein
VQKDAEISYPISDETLQPCWHIEPNAGEPGKQASKVLLTFDPFDVQPPNSVLIYESFERKAENQIGDPLNDGLKQSTLHCNN